MIPLFLRAGLRILWRHRVRTALLVCGVGLTVAVIIAVLIASEAGVTSFREAALLGSPRTPWLLRAQGGLLDTSRHRETLQRLANNYDLLFFLQSSATVHTSRTPRNGLPIRLIGIARSADPPQSGTVPGTTADAFVQPDFFSQMGISEGEGVRVTAAGREARMFRPAAAAIDDLPPDAIVVSLSSLQRYLGEPNRVQSIGLTPRSGGVDPAALAQALLAEGLVLRSAGAESAASDRLLSAYRGNLLFLVALTVGLSLFVVHSAGLLAVEHREDEFRTLATLGSTRLTLFSIVFAEALLLGAVASAVGLSLGYPLSRILAGLFLTTAAELYMPSASFRELSFLTFPKLYAAAFIAGVLLTVLGFLVPSIRTARALPALHTRSDMGAERAGQRWLLVGGVTMVFCTVILLGSARSLPASAIYGALLLLAAAAGCLTTPLAALLGLILERLVHRVGHVFPGQAAASFLYASAHVRGALRLYAVPLGVAAVGVMLLVGLAGMIASFRDALSSWVTERVQADFYLGSGRNNADGSPQSLPAEVLKETALRIGSQAELIRFATVYGSLGDSRLVIAGSDVRKAAGRSLYKVREGRLAIDRLESGEEVLISESGARKLALGPGDRLSILGRDRTVQAVFQEFTTEVPLVLLDLSALEQAAAAGATSIGVFRRDNSTVESLDRTLEEIAAQWQLVLTRNTDLKRQIFEVFDRTFEITELIRLIILFVCAVAFAVTELQLFYRRRIELVTVQTLGMSLPVLAGAIGAQMVLLSLAPLLTGGTAGIYLAWALAEIVNPISFGWSFPFVFQPRMITAPALLFLGGVLVLMIFPLGYVRKVLRADRLRDI